MNENTKVEIGRAPYKGTTYQSPDEGEEASDNFLAEMSALVERYGIVGAVGCFIFDCKPNQYICGSVVMGNDQGLMAAIREVRECSMDVIKEKAIEEMAAAFGAHKPEPNRPSPHHWQEGLVFPQARELLRDFRRRDSTVRNAPMYADELYEPVFEGEV